MPSDRLRLASLPTPLHPLERLSDSVRADIWIKRDDLTGFALGGNKVRKAERLLADALADRAEVVLTGGAAQSNHARVIAAAARCAGLDVELFLTGDCPERSTGNLILNEMSEAVVHFVGAAEHRAEAMRQRAQDLAWEGRRPYTIPIGGSNAIGARAYADAAIETAEQLADLPTRPTRLIFATSSGGTYAGLLAGVATSRAPIALLGIRVDADPGHAETIASIATEVAEAIGMEIHFDPHDVALCSDYVGEGYGISSTAGQDAIRRAWQQEGILLDAVYSAKAMAGLLDLAARGAFAEERVVFVHTGGEPSMFA
jgi:L-cysteate sulfo-lyase